MEQKLLLFDIDKTLTYGPDAHGKAFEAAFQLRGIQAVFDIRSSSGSTDRLILRDYFKRYGVNGDPIEECFAIMTLVFTAHLDQYQLILLPGVRELLEMLYIDQRYIIGHVTGNLKTIALAKMKKVGIDHYFNFKLGGYGCAPHSSRHELVLYAIKQAKSLLGFEGNKRNVVLFGDTPHDAVAGRMAGVTTVIVLTGHHTPSDFTSENPDLMISDFHTAQAEVLKFLER